MDISRSPWSSFRTILQVFFQGPRAALTPVSDVPQLLDRYANDYAEAMKMIWRGVVADGFHGFSMDPS